MLKTDWILLIIVAFIAGMAIGWAITYVVMLSKHSNKCNHEFKETLRVDVIGVHKAAYICTKCGKTKTVEL